MHDTAAIAVTLSTHTGITTGAVSHRVPVTAAARAGISARLKMRRLHALRGGAFCGTGSEAVANHRPEAKPTADAVNPMAIKTTSANTNQFSIALLVGAATRKTIARSSAVAIPAPTNTARLAQTQFKPRSTAATHC